MQHSFSEPRNVIVAGYVRRSSEMQKDNYSIDAQKRALKEAAKLRGLPEPIFFEDDERSTRGEQIAKRPGFELLLDEVQAGRIQIVMVHTFDRWSRNVMVTLQSFRILSQARIPFISLSEHIDYSTPEGMLQLTILAAFAAYFSDMLAKHTSKGKSERVVQGLYNGDIPFGYRSTGPKAPPEFDPEEYPGLRLLGELRMKGVEADKIADALNEAGYRTGSKRFGARLFNKDTVTAMLRNELYAAYIPGDDRGAVKYKEQRFRGLLPAVFTFDEWQKIRAMTQSMHHASTRTEQVKVATVEERYEMVTIVLEPGGLCYDLENKIIAAIKPRPAFLPVLRMLNGVIEFDETRGLLVTEHWCERNRRASDYHQEAQRDRQTRAASSSSRRRAVCLFCVVYLTYRPGLNMLQASKGGKRRPQEVDHQSTRLPHKQR